MRDENEQRIYPAALVCSIIAEVNRDPDRRPEPFTPAFFMPGAKTDDEEMREFVEAVQRGDTFESDPEAIAAFKKQMEEAFGKRRDETTGIERGNLVVVDQALV